MRVKKCLKYVVIGIVIVALFWSQIAWAIPCVNSQSDIGLADKLAAMSGAHESGIQAVARQEVAGLFLKSAILKEMGITNLTDIVRNMDELVRKGIICFSRPDINNSSRSAIYIFEDNAFIKVTKPGESVKTDFDELLEISGKEDTVGDTKYEWCNVPKDETRLGLINSFLGRLSDGRWFLMPAVDEEKTGVDLKGPVKTFAPHGVPVDYSSITDGFIKEYEAGLRISNGKVSVQDSGTDQSKQLAELIGNAFAILDKLPDGELRKYWETVLSSEQNEVPIRIRVNNKISENSVRYYNYKDSAVEIIFDEVFIKALLTLGTSNNTACWLLAERLFHELGHDNKDGSLYENMKEEYEMVKKDILLHEALKRLGVQAEIDRFFASAKPEFPSGYYFRLMDALISDPEIIKLFDDLIEGIEDLENQSESVYNKRDVIISDKSEADRRTARLYRAYDLANPDYPESITSKLKKRKELKGTFLGDYLDILIHRGTVDGRESFLFLFHSTVDIVPFDQLKNPRVPDGSGRVRLTDPEKEARRWARQYYAMHKRRRISDGIGVTEAENGRGMQQKWHKHDTTQEFTTSLCDNTELRYGHEMASGTSTEIRDGKEYVVDGPDKHKEVVTERGIKIVIDFQDKVGFGKVICMPKNTFHTLRNPSTSVPSVDFTVKDPVTQIIKTFTPPEEIQLQNVQIRKMTLVEKHDGWSVYEFEYDSPYNTNLVIDETTGEMKFIIGADGEPIPIMSTPVRLKLRIIVVEPGKETDALIFNPLYDGLQIVRVFPWPRNIPEDWILDRDHRGITGEVTVFDLKGNPIHKGKKFFGGDLILLDSNTGEDIHSYVIKNTSEKHQMMFFCLEKLEDVSERVIRTAQIPETTEELGPVKTFAPHGVPVDYSSITDGFIDEYEAGLRISDGKVSVQDRGTNQSKQLAELLGNAFDILDKLPEGELKKYWKTVLSAEQNKIPIKIRVNNKISENSVRYYNYKDNVEIIFDEVFIKALLTLGTSNNTAYWLLAERLFHEIGHDNKSGTMEDERFEEARLILRDLELNRALKNGKIPSISEEEVNTYFKDKESKPEFKSGYYFKFLTQEIDIYIKQYGEAIKPLKKYFKDNDELTIINLWLWKRIYEYYFKGIDKPFDRLIREKYYELVNIEGRRTGRITPKGLLLKEGDLHRDIRVFMLTEDGRLLANQRIGRKREPDCYSESVTHRVELGKSCFETVLRSIAGGMKKTRGDIRIDIKDIKDVDIEGIKRERLFRLDEFPSEIHGGGTVSRTISFRFVYILTRKQEEKLREIGNEFLDLDRLRVDAIINIEKYTVSLRNALTTGTYDDIRGSSAKIRKTEDRVERFERGEFYEDELEKMSAKEIADMLRLINLGNHDMEEKLLLYSGAPGSGKGTVMDLTFKGAGAPYSDLVQQLILYHTRNPRKEEKDGEEYNFGYHDVGDEGKNRLLVLAKKGLIRTAFVNQQLQGLAEDDFNDEVKLHRDDIHEPILKDDVPVTGQYQDDNDGNGEYLLVRRRIKGLSSVFKDGKVTILEGGYGWYKSIKKTEQGGKKGVFTIFLTPFTDEQLELRKRNKMYIDREYQDPEERIKAYWILNRMRERKEIEEISIEDDSTLQRELEKEMLEPLENFKLMEGAENARKNAKIIEAEEFITDLNYVLENLFKSAFRFDAGGDKALARELAYEVQMKLIKDRGYKSYRLRRPTDEEKKSGRFKDDSETYVRVLEGVIQIFLKDEYKDDYTGDIVKNQFVWSKGFEEIEKSIQEVAEGFCKKYFVYLMRALIIRDMLEKHNMASKVLYSYLLSCAKGEEEEVRYLKNLFNEYSVDRLENRRKAAGWLNDMIGKIEKEQNTIRGISDFPARKEHFWQFYNSSDFGGAKGAPWGKTLLLRLYLPSVLHDANQNIKDLVLAIIDRIDHGKKIEDFPSICRQCGIGKDSEDWNMAVKEIYPLVKGFVKENSIVASSLSLHPDKLEKKETIYYSIKIDEAGNILWHTKDIRDVAKGDSRFNEELINSQLQKLIKYLMEKHEGILGPIEEVVIVDNLGGIDSEVPQLQKGGAAYLNKKQILIDIDARQDEAAFMDTGIHESFEGNLRLVEGNPGIQEVTATYCSLKELRDMVKNKLIDLDSYIKFLKRENNGLDSSSYAMLIEHLKGNLESLDDDGLIALALMYVLNTPRYEHLHNDLKGVMSSDIKEAERKIEMARNIFRDIISAKKVNIEVFKQENTQAAEKVKIAGKKSKFIMKIKMLMSEAKVMGVDMVDDLIANNKYQRLDIDELLKLDNEYILKWLKTIMAGKDKSPFIYYSLSGKNNVDAFLERHNLEQGKIPDGVSQKDIIDVRDLGFALENGLEQNMLSLPTIYSISSIYLAGKIVLAGGDIKALKECNRLAYNTLMAMFSAIYGDEFTEKMLVKMIFGTLPMIVPVTGVLNVLRDAIVQIETAV